MQIYANISKCIYKHMQIYTMAQQVCLLCIYMQKKNPFIFCIT